MINNKDTNSLWQNVETSAFSALNQNDECDVCIVGAGISGLSIAYNLLKEGKSVIVLDKNMGISGETSMTSAHISNALDDKYFNLINIIGEENSKLAAESHSWAISEIERIIQDENIHCNFSWVDGFLFLSPNSATNILDNEIDACKKIGLKNVTKESSVPNLKLNVGACVKFPNQAQFHVVKYLKGLQKTIVNMGGKIYGDSQVVKSTETSQSILIETKNKNIIKCKDVVFATNSPTNHLVAMHTKEAAYRSYVIGLKIPKNSFPKILLWDTETPYHYVRIHEESGYDILMIGGEDHRVGQGNQEFDPFELLEMWTEDFLGITGEVLYRWSGQIIETLDGLAYIGKSPMGGDHVFEVSGDSGHGITHGTIAGKIISDLILKKENAWEQIYNPQRKNWNTAGHYVIENLKGVSQNIDWITPGDVASASDIKKGEGAIVRKGLSKIATYRDDDGHLHECSAVCPHLGALVRWNSAEKTWDCPFHGSRFDTNGQVINGPAIESLKTVNQGCSSLVLFWF